MLPIIEFLKVFSGMLRSGKMSYSDALTRFRAQYGRPPDGLELTSIRKEVEKGPSNVFDLTGKQIDTSRPIIGGKNVANDVDGIINNLKSMEPMDAMKEANLIIGRKGQYKNLSIDESQKILKDTNDHIFSRDIQYDEFGDPIKRDPDDFASGGLARVGYADGSYKSEGLFGISMEDIRKYKEKEIMDRTPPFAIPDDWLEKFLKRFEKTGTYEQPMASGGIARVGYAGGKLVKGAPWVINKLKEQLFDMDLGIGGSTFSKLTSTQKDFYKKELNTLIKQLEQGGEIPKEMLDTMIADPKFKSVVKTRSTDKDLYDLEDALLDHQAGKQADQIVDDVFGPFDADGKLNKKAVLQEVKDAEEKMLLDKFDVKDRMKNASGGRAGRGLNYLLGEDDQNVRTPYQGGLPGLLGE